MSRQSVKASIDANIKRNGVQAITGQILNGVLNLMLAFSADKEEVETALGEKYEKPAGGIPKTDLSEGVQSSLAKADTALQTHQDISGKADKSDTYTKTQVDTKISQAVSQVDTDLENKVDKIPGKGLSTNDYTDADKAKVSHLPNNTESALSLKADKSDTYTKTQVDVDLENKADKSTTYTKTEVNGLLDGKVSKETGKGLSSNDYTNVDKGKVANLPTNTTTDLTNLTTRVATIETELDGLNEILTRI